MIVYRDYPYTTVPNQVHRLFRAQQLHDRKHYDERMLASPGTRKKMEQIDYLRPIIADADTGYVQMSLMSLEWLSNYLNLATEEFHQ